MRGRIVPSVWIVTRTTKSGDRRYRVELQLGGLRTYIRHAGSFKTKRAATIHKNRIESRCPAIQAARQVLRWSQAEVVTG